MAINNGPLFRVRSYTVLAMIGWTTIALGLMWLNWDWMQNHILGIAQAEARASIEKDLLYRGWNASHGGVYVPITEDTQPNPYLNVFERDIVTPSGRLLTLINPAYMTRQVYEIQNKTGIRAHLTSLKPYNPNNTADEWETQALRSFENGETEVHSLAFIDEKEYMRLMRPFITTEECLKCHASQGYQVGEIRGGLSVSVPMSNYTEIKQSSLRIIFTGYGTIWIVGLAAIYMTSKDLKKRFQEREEMMLTVQKSREEYHTILNTTMDGFWQVDINGNLLEVNNAYCEMSGYSRTELLQMNIHDLETHEIAEETENQIKHIPTKGTDRFETTHRRKNGSTFFVEASTHSMGDEEGKMFAFLRDITEPKNIRESLRASEEKFSQIFQFSPAMITLSSLEDGRYLDVNQKFLETFGFSREEIIGTTSADLGVIDHEKREELKKILLSTGRFKDFEITFHKKDGSKIICLYNGELIELRGKACLLSLAQDITQLKNTEVELRAREAHLKQAQYLAKLGTWEWSPSTDKTTWSDEMLKIYGITREEFTGNGQDYINFTHPDDRPSQQSNIRRDFEKAGQTALETGQTIDEIPDPKEFRILRPDGSICWVEGDAIEYVDEQGNPLRMLGILRDITHQKLDEQAIRKSEEQYRLLFDEMMDGFALHEIICDENGHPIDYRFLAVNSAFETLTGLQAKDIIGKTVLEILPITEKVWIERYGKVALSGEPNHFEEFAAALDRYYEVRTFSSEPNKFAVIFHDISQRKYSETITLARMKFVEIATTHSLDTLVQTILDEAEKLTGSCIGFYHLLEADQKTLSLQNWSTRTIQEFCRAEGKGMHYSVDEAGVWVDSIHMKKPVIHNDYASLPASRRKGLPDGHAEVIRELVVPVMRGDKVVAILGVGNKQAEYTHRDMDIVQQLADLAMEIVERKRAEDAQVKTQQNYENLIQTIDGIVWEADAQNLQFSFVSDQAERLLGYPTQNWIEDPHFWENHIHPEDRLSSINFCIEQTKQKLAHEFEYRMIAADESIIWLRDVVSVIIENDQPVKLRGIMIDITAKKQADEKLRQLSLVVEQSPASVIITDAHGDIEYVNSKFTQVSGYTLEEVIGKNPRILRSIHTSLEIYEQLWKSISAGTVWSGELQNKKKTGELHWEDVLISPIFDEHGKITHFTAIKEDITKRKQAADALQQSEKNLRKAQYFAHLGSWTWNIKTNHLEWSDETYHIFDLNKETFTGLLPDVITQVIHPDDRAKVEQYNLVVINEGKPVPLEYRIIWKNGSIRTIWAEAGELIRDEKGNPALLSGTVQDITERKQAEVEILEKSMELEALFNISAHLRTAQTAEEMIPLVLSQMSQALNADANALIMLNADGIHFTYALGDGLLSMNTGMQFDVENSISGRIIQTLQPYITDDYVNDPLRSDAIPYNKDIGPAILVPLQSETEFIGTLLCARTKESHTGPFTAAEVKLLTAIGEMVGNALRRAKLYDQALARLQRVQALRSIDAAINANMDSTVTLRVLINQIMILMNVDAAAVLLYNPHTHVLEYAAAHGFHHKDIENAHLKLGHGFANIAITEHRLIKIPDLAHAQDPIYQEIAGKEGFISCYVSPMIAKGQVCGVLEVYSRTALNPNQEWFDFLESLGAQAAIAIDNAQLFINLEKSNLELSLAYDATIAGWSHALDLKDKETEGHTLRVTARTIELAKLAGLNEAEIMHIRRGALLHDIGKMGIPDNILNKAGELTPEEWEIMRQHPQSAYNMLSPIEFLRLALEIPYCHHEKWDGTGYSRGLQKDQIPYAARLFAVVDVWDALTSNRSYRKAWSHKKTIAFIKSQSGKHFDPEVVDLFIKMMDNLDVGMHKK